MIIDWISAILILVGTWTILRRFRTLGILGFFVPQWRKKRRAKPAETPAGPEYQKYGHPFAPVPTLHEALPSPPAGYAWEISVESGNYENGDETLWLACGLINVVTGSRVAGRKTDLLYRSHYDHASDLSKLWSDHYVGATEGYILGSAQSAFVFKFVEWAEAEKAKIARKDFIGGEFMIKGA